MDSINSNWYIPDNHSNMNIIYDSNMLYNIANDFLSNSPWYSWSNITITENDVLVSGVKS